MESANEDILANSIYTFITLLQGLLLKSFLSQFNQLSPQTLFTFKNRASYI
jgi:hypothetical protein